MIEFAQGKGVASGDPYTVSQVRALRVVKTTPGVGQLRFGGDYQRTITLYAHTTYRFEKPVTVYADAGTFFEYSQDEKDFLDMPAASAGTSADPTSTNGSDEVVSVQTTVTTLIAANPNRRRVTVQNLSTEPVFISKQNTVTSAPAKVAAVLSPCRADGDGTGGAVTFEGWSGALYGIIAMGTANVCVSDF